MPSGVAITSVADQLDSHLSSMQAASVSMKASVERKKSVLRPLNELARLALDRRLLKEDNVVRPVTELSRMGMDRWLDAAVMTKHGKAIVAQRQPLHLEQHEEGG